MSNKEESPGLIVCSECGTQAPLAAGSCPACGCELPSALPAAEKGRASKAALETDKELQILGAAIIGLGALLLVLGYTHAAAWCCLIGGVTFIGARARAWLRQA
jgi:hypothetical protein